MAKITRRTFLATASAIPFAVWFEQNAFAKTPLVRYNARSAHGQQMLKIYAKTVAAMQAKPPGDPIGWLFQWYTHAVRPDRTKAGEISSIYPSPSPQKTLAQAAWSTCQAHFDPSHEDFFLPWHRMYVYFFEHIIRKISGVKTFTLPYWNYSASGAAHGVIPKQFRLPASALYKSLYMQNRNTTPDVNGGEAIDKFDPGALALTSLAQCNYSPLGALPGFCQALDFGLHGNVHVDTGDGTNMGSVPWAARDPVFWMHHCNIDRLWASWNKAGRHNPSTAAFLAQTFTFANANGTSVTAKVQDFLSIGKLGYAYDAYESVPKCKAPLAAAPKPVNLMSTSNHALGAAPSHARLKLAPEAVGTKLSAVVRTLKADESLFLVLKNLHANVNPDVLYHVYLDLPEGADPKTAAEHHVGVINFFNAAGHGADHEAASGPDDRFYSFDITQLAKKLLAKGALEDEPQVTIMPLAKGTVEAQPLVGEISIVRQ